MAKKESKAVVDKRGKLDLLLGKVTSRKLLVWVTCTVLLFLGEVSPAVWETLSLAYVGTQAFVDAAVSWKHGK
ncbi:MAG: hypothetical protein CL398_01190 [Acidiferrobacteraceae bacterium]|nr:hypothetical protein [Acidiferrobacteraceae bacterium]|tara:strand:- start:44 stop:262 length:219 start_codon:yes stop_codon:yes gene_type:complete